MVCCSPTGAAAAPGSARWLQAEATAGSFPPRLRLFCIVINHPRVREGDAEAPGAGIASCLTHHPAPASQLLSQRSG